MAGKMKVKNIGGNDVWVDTETGDIKHYEPSYTSSGVAADRNIPAGVPSNVPLGQMLTKQASENAQLSQLEDATLDPGEHENEVNKAKARAAAYTNIPEGAYTNKQLIERMNNPTMDKIAENKTAQEVGNLRNELNKEIETALEQNLGVPQSDSYVPNASEQAIAEESEEQKLADAENRAQRDETINLQHDIQESERKALQERGDPELSKMQDKNKIDQTKTPSSVEKSEGNKSGGVTEETSQSEMPKAPASANVDFSDYLKNYYGPKNGADYLKALWSNGAGGKAAAIGNVLGNLLGATGKGLAGQDYKTDWQTYKDNYIKEMADRNQKAFDQNMDISRQLRTNDVARGEMLKALEQYEKIGKGMTPEKFENIRKALTATGNSSQMEYYLSSVLGDLSSDPDFMKAVKDAGSNAAELLGNITKFGANTLRPLNYVFGGLNNGIIK